MSWLIESYLNETREANKTPEHDHPGSLEMKNSLDYADKKDNEMDTSLDTKYNSLRRENRKYQAGNKYAIRKGYENLPKHDIDNYRRINKYVAKKYPELDTNTLNGQTKFISTADAIERHNRRHPDHAVSESVSDIVELLQ